MLKRFLPLFSGLALVACAPNPSSHSGPDSPPNHFSDSNFVAIAEAQDRRDTYRLGIWLKNPNPLYRERAAFALGSVQDSSLLGDLVPLLKDSVPEVRASAVFAVGQMGSGKGWPYLKERIKTEKDSVCLSNLATALGRVVPAADSLRPLMDKLSRPHATEAAYRLAIRGLANDSLARKVELLGGDPQARPAAARFFARARSLEILPFFPTLKGWLQEPSVADKVAIPVCSALERTQDPQVQGFLRGRLEQALNGGSFSLKVALWRSLGPEQIAQADSLLRETLMQEPPLVGLTAAEQFLAKGNENQAPFLMEVQEGLPMPSVRAVLLSAVLIWSKDPTVGGLRERATNQLRQITYEKEGYAACLAIRGLGGNWKNWPILDTLAFSHPVLAMRTYAMEGLVALARRKVGAPDAPGLAQNLAAVFKKGVESKDVSLVGQAAEVLRDPKLGFKGILTDTLFLAQALGDLKLPREVETWYEVRQTLDYFAGRESAPKSAPEFSNPIDWDFVKTIPAEVEVEISTTKGEIVVALWVEDCPGSVANFVRLVRAQFYDGKFFHRVIPNFVAQGGCPRGDGWGGDSLTLRSEFTPRTYAAGALGLASAGKDTESCQWFISTVDTPHLDGRYTTFGQVVRGLDIAQALEVGDAIRYVRIR